jgi:hypothetical protein
MADLENNTPEPEVVPEVNPIEQRAMEQGWVPEDEWKGDPADWRPAKEFIDRGELIREIQNLKRDNRAIREGVQEFKKHHEQVKALAYKQALADLRADKKKALEDGDADAVIEIDDKIADAREAQRAAEAAPQPEVATPTEPNQEFVKWESRNGWYRQDRAMKAVADQVANDLHARGERDVVRMLAEVDKEVRKAFPAKFENPNRAKAPSVEGSSKPARVGDSDVYLTEMEKQIMNKIVRSGAITKEAYLKEFKARQAG